MFQLRQPSLRSYAMDQDEDFLWLIRHDSC